MIWDIWDIWARLRYGPSCGALPPSRLVDAGPCVICSRGAHLSEWHADGNGFIWNEDRWAWMGPDIPCDDADRQYPPLTEFRPDATH